MAATGVQAWKSICEKNLCGLPIPFDRQQGQNESTHPFNISLKVIDGLLTKVSIEIKSIPSNAPDNSCAQTYHKTIRAYAAFLPSVNTTCELVPTSGKF